jgi:hypothetical protein
MSLLNEGFNVYYPITPSDSVNILSGLTDSIYVGTKGSTGTIVAVMQDLQVATFVGLIPGTVYPIRCVRVNSTTTDASNLVALYIR